jgi:hypothetical protein
VGDRASLECGPAHTLFTGQREKEKERERERERERENIIITLAD